MTARVSPSEAIHAEIDELFATSDGDVRGVGAALEAEDPWLLTSGLPTSAPVARHEPVAQAPAIRRSGSDGAVRASDEKGFIAQTGETSAFPTWRGY